jgi:2-oxoglutarate dehydrogenase complex dehydrogenase (E1) component-like enzyme
LEKLGEIINSYENAEELCWVQEEPQNMGIWNYISPRIQSLVSINKRFGSLVALKAQPLPRALIKFILRSRKRLLMRR